MCKNDGLENNLKKFFFFFFVFSHPGGPVSLPGVRESGCISGRVPDDPGGFTCMQWHVTANPAVRSSWNLNSTDMRFYACSSCKQVWRRSDWKSTSFFFHHSSVRNSKMIDQISGPNSNLFEILCLSSLPVSMMETEFRVTEKRWIHHFLDYKSMGEKIQRSRANNSKVYIPIRPKLELIQAFLPVLITCKFDKYLIKSDWEKLETSFFFTTQGHVTPKWLVRSGRNSNPSNISCLSLLPVSLMKIEFK